MMCTVDSSMVGPQWQSYETLSRLGCLEIPQFTVITTAAPAPWQRCRAQPGCFMIKVTAPAPAQLTPQLTLSTGCITGLTNGPLYHPPSPSLILHHNTTLRSCYLAPACK